MAFSYTPTVSDYTGIGILAGNWTAAAVTAGAITSGFKQVIHASFQSNVAATAVTYSASTSGVVSITCASGDAGTFLIYGR